MKYLVLAAIAVVTLDTSNFSFGQAPDVRITADQVYVKVQKICPVSGQPLGGHGSPIKTTVGKDEEQVYLCCKGCFGKKIAPKH